MKLRAIVVGMIFFIVPAIIEPSAFAHSTIVRATPSQNSLLAVSPKEISLQFGEALLVLAGKNPNSISVVTTQGKLVSSGDAIISGSQISKALKGPLKSGKYIVRYRVVSADGHVVTGSYTFTVK